MAICCINVVANRVGIDGARYSDLAEAEQEGRDRFCIWLITMNTIAIDFARAMPDEFKYDDTIDTFTAYKRYIASKPWVKDNYRRIPERKPDWI